MTGKILKINFQQALKAVKTLEVLSDMLKDAATEDVFLVLADVGKNWEGEASEAFCKKLRLLYDQIYQEAVAVNAAAMEIGNQVQKIYEAEQKAIITVREKKSY